MKVAVTGGSGFIGSALVSELARAGHEVSSIDIAEGIPGDFTFRKCDLTNLADSVEALKGFEVTYHLAGVVLEGVRENPFTGCLLNAALTANVVEACHRNRVPKVVFASSFYVYDGLPSEMVVNEYTPLNILGMELFGGTKVYGENILGEYRRKYGLEFVILRFGSAYGLGKCTNVVKTFLESGWQDKEIEVWGPGNRTNQYTFVGDIAHGAVLAIGSSNDTYNLISPEQTSVKSLGDLLQKDYGFRVSFRLDKKEGLSMPYMSSRKAIDVLGWKPVLLQDGIKKMVEQHLTPRDS